MKSVSMRSKPKKRAEQADSAIYEKRNYYQKELPKYEDGYRQLPHYLPIFIFPIYLRAKYIKAISKLYVCRD